MITIEIHPGELEFIKEAIREKMDRLNYRVQPALPIAKQAPTTITVPHVAVKRGPGRPRKVAK